jgi:UDP-N-acetylglucosamine:LPS N-acetylglucosamine transferase
MAEMSNAAHAVARPDAAQRVADELLALVADDGH